MQVEHKTEKGIVLFVKLPDDALSFKVLDNLRILVFETKTTKGAFGGLGDYEMTPSKGFKIIGFSSDIKEEQLCKMFAPKLGLLYEMFGYNYLTSDVIISFKSLMKHLQVNESEKWIVLFKPN